VFLFAGFKWRTNGTVSQLGQYWPSLPEGTTVGEIAEGLVYFVGVAVRLVREGVYIYSVGAPLPDGTSSWVNMRLDSAELNQAIAKNPEANYALDLIASTQTGQVTLEVDLVAANNKILLPTNFWKENFTACDAECGGPVGKQSMRDPQCLDGFTGHVLTERNCLPRLDSAKTRACSVASCDEVRCWALYPISHSMTFLSVSLAEGGHIQVKCQSLECPPPCRTCCLY
jgi:hypothetical protein